MTYHRPVGKTDLDDDDWVLTPTGEVPELLARSEDPDEAGIRAKREAFRMACAADKKLVSKSADGEVLYPSGESRQSVLAKARAEAKDEAQRRKAKVLPNAHLAFLSAERKKEEDALRAFLSSESTIRAAEKKFPDSQYRTMSGPLADRPQKAVSYLSGKTRPQAEDAVIQRLYA